MKLTRDNIRPQAPANPVINEWLRKAVVSVYSSAFKRLLAPSRLKAELQTHRPGIMERRERGIQLVEVVLVMPVLLALLAGTAEFGRYFYTYSALARATRVSARYLSGRLLNDTEKSIAKNLAVCGLAQTMACSSSAAVVPGLTASNIEITTTGGSSILPTTVKVRIINYNHQSVFNLGNWTGTAWTTVAVSPSTTMRYLLEN